MLDRGSFLLLSGGFVRAAESDDPRAHPILAEVFIGVFPEEERAEAGALKTLTALVERMTPEERESARARLAEGEARARGAAERAEYARGYYLLGAHEESLRVSGELIRDDPKNLDALRLSAAASFRSDDFEAAARDARAVLDADPDDKDAKVIWMFTKDRARAGRMSAPQDPFAGKKDEGPSTDGGGSVAAVASAVKTGLMDNLPIPPSPLDGVPADATTERVALSAFTAAATGVGGLLLFMGIGGRRLEEKFPNIRRNMGIGAGVGGALLYGAVTLAPAGGTLTTRLLPFAPQAQKAFERGANTPVSFAITKAEARAVISGLNPPADQAQSAFSAVSRGTASSSFRITKEFGDIVIRTTRPGRNGYQSFEYRIAPNGTKSVVQTAYDAAGNLVHYDPK